MHTSTIHAPRRRATPAILLAAALAPSALAQSAIYSNGSEDPADPGLATGARASSGQFAPAGGQWSELQSESGIFNAVAGFSSHVGDTGGYRFADDFTIVGDSGWRIDSVRFYAYQVGATTALSPISAINLRIWNGPPNDPDSVILFGDAATNRLESSVPSGLYRAFGSTATPFPAVPDDDRIIWQTTAAVGGIVLPPGSYWIDWQYQSVTPGVEIFAPAITLPRTRSLPGWNARQFRPAGGGAWVPAMDVGKPIGGVDVPQDFPFIITGSAGCIADFTGDGQLDFSDYLAFLNLYDAGDSRADLNADGFVDFADFLVFLNLYETPCP